MNRMEELYRQAKSDIWMKRFAVFCRIAMALGFIPTGIVKILGERFTGLPSNNPLGHYFDALFLTGYYYTFIGIIQFITAILILIPRTALLGALMYFPILINICVLTYATRFDGTRLITMMVFANLFLLVWDYDRLKHILIKQPKTEPAASIKHLSTRHRAVFFSGVFAIVAIIIIGTFYLYEIVPGNSQEECINQCPGNKYPEACEAFCDCIYKDGKPLDSCLAVYDSLKITHRSGKR